MSQRNAETYASVRQQIEETLANKDLSRNIYESTNGISRILDAIIATKGEDWVAHVVDEHGKPMLTDAEQQQFTYAFQDHIYALLTFLGTIRDHTQTDQEGGDNLTPASVSEQSKQSDKPITTKQPPTVTHGEGEDPAKLVGIDDIYTKFIERIRNVDKTVNDFASQYGVLKLEKDFDATTDIRLIPETVAVAISSLMAPFILPTVTKPFLDNIKVSFRTIVFTVYMAMDVARISMGVSGRENARKILSILVSLLDLLRGDWKKSILSFIGYFGTTPLLYGEVAKVFLTAFNMFSPPLQESIIIGSLDASKSFLIGLLLAISQVTMPLEVRRPIILALDKIAQHKAKIDDVLKSEGLAPRPDYLSPTFQDLNNLQAVMTDPAYLCSCEFQEMVDAVNRSAPIKIALQLLRIPVTKEYKEYTCGTGPCKPFVTEIVENSQEELQKQENQTQQAPQEKQGNQVQQESQEKLQQPIPTPISNTNKTTTTSSRGGRLIHARRSRLLPN